MPPDLNETAADQYHSEILNSVRPLFQGLLVPVVCGTGIFLNAVTVVVMTRRSMRTSPNIYLAANGFCDGVYLACSLVLALKHDVPETPYYDLYRNLEHIFLFLIDLAQYCSVGLIVIFTTERYVAVCHPLQANVICTVSKAISNILLCAAVCALLMLPRLFEAELDGKEDSTEDSALQVHKILKKVYFWLMAILFTMIPCVLLAFLNVKLIRALHDFERRRQIISQQSGDRSEAKVTLICIAVVALFLVCQTPQACLMLLSGLINTNLEKSLGNISNFLVCLNATGNSCLYCLLSPKYRRTLLALWKTRCSIAAKNHHGCGLQNVLKSKSPVGYFKSSAFSGSPCYAS